MASSPQSLSDADVEALKAKLEELRDALRAQESESEESRAAVELDQQSLGA